MEQVLETARFRQWLERLRDRRAVARINTRIIRLGLGLAGDAKSVGDGVQELRFVFGPGYRVYFAEKDSVLIVLLAGGDKSTQRRDIEDAKALWRDWRANHE